MTSPGEPRKCGSAVFLPLALAFGGGSIQLASCGTWFVGLGVPVGLAVSIGGIIAGHIVLLRMKRQALQGRWLARVGLTFAYLSVLSIPIVGYGILLVVGGICSGGLFSK